MNALDEFVGRKTWALLKKKTLFKSVKSIKFFRVGLILDLKIVLEKSSSI